MMGESVWLPKGNTMGKTKAAKGTESQETSKKKGLRVRSRIRAGLLIAADGGGQTGGTGGPGSGSPNHNRTLCRIALP